MKQPLTNKIPLGRAIIWIFLSILLISGTAWMGLLYYFSLKESHSKDDQYKIVAIIQSTAHSEELKTVYLAELLHLSMDEPKNLYAFNTKWGEKQLMKSPLIKRAKIKKNLPGTLYIEYEKRHPIAYVGDFTNTAIDEEGYFFPFSPFFTPKKLPIVYLGLSVGDSYWGKSLFNSQQFQLVLAILKAWNRQVLEKSLHLKQIDVAQAFSQSYGQRQIVLQIEDLDSATQTYVRLDVDTYDEGINNFLRLKEKIKSFAILDLRIPQLGFIKK